MQRFLQIWAYPNYRNKILDIKNKKKYYVIFILKQLIAFIFKLRLVNQVNLKSLLSSAISQIIRKIIIRNGVIKYIITAKFQAFIIITQANIKKIWKPVCIFGSFWEPHLISVINMYLKKQGKLDIGQFKNHNFLYLSYNVYLL